MEPAEKLSITVTATQAKLIREKVEQGSFGSASEVIRAALRAFEREEQEHAERIASIKARIKASIEDPRPGIPMEEAFEQVRRRIQEMAESGDDPAASRRS
jgi:antitoxin ParD1/3/4